jgi:hypothetical protein
MFDPINYVAWNIHNGNPATFHYDGHKWMIMTVNAPAQWMVDQLWAWFCKWIEGKVA